MPLKSSIKAAAQRSLTSSLLYQFSKIETTGDEKVDRLPVIIPGSGIETTPVCTEAVFRNRSMAYAMVKGVKDCIDGLCFDATFSNRGRKKGACVLIEKLLERKVLYLASSYP